MLNFHQFSLQNLKAFEFVCVAFEVPQILEALRCHLTKDNVSQVHKGARRERDYEATVAGIFLTDATQQSRSIVRQLEGFVAEGWSEDGVVASFEMTKFGMRPGDNIMEVIANQGETFVVVTGGSQQQSLEIFGRSRDHVFKELLSA
jgi:hypothetical protein